MKKRRIMIITGILVLLSVAAVIGYNYYKSSSSSPESPVISFDSDMVIVGTDYTEDELLVGVTAYDPEDGDVTDSILIEGISRFIGDSTAKVTYAAFDSNNHMVKAERLVRFEDYESPTFELSCSLIMQKKSNIDILKYVTATDVFDGDISDNVKYTLLGNSVKLTEVGEHRVQFRVTNKMGDTVHLELPVEITDRNPNSAEITLSDYLVYIDKGAEFDAASFVEGYTVSNTYREGYYGLRTQSDLDTSKSGVYTVDYIYGYGDSMSRARLIVVVE